MKASIFLKLVGAMITAQQDYYKARKSKEGNSYSLLLHAKELEKQVLAVVQEGKLEPDEPVLDFPGEVRPTDTPKQKTLFE